MSMSKEQKRRKKLVQQGNISPDIIRGSWNGVNPVAKKTPTLVEKRKKQENKHRSKWSSHNDSGGSIFSFKKNQTFSYNTCKTVKRGRLLSYEQRPKDYRGENQQDSQKNKLA